MADDLHRLEKVLLDDDMDIEPEEAEQRPEAVKTTKAKHAADETPMKDREDGVARQWKMLNDNIAALRQTFEQAVSHWTAISSMPTMEHGTGVTGEMRSPPQTHGTWEPFEQRQPNSGPARASAPPRHCSFCAGDHSRKLEISRISAVEWCRYS
ncbi:unnamed protein product [Caenorhabditis bovis]|uniref:Uncharacterized protein n=1 Tax=Caenorhabditis bovis TaxID=2654633 RepID=A0A8S1FFE8_9PELO|nr:unnamed protein product [Caenorhabditis bovis]